MIIEERFEMSDADSVALTYASSTAITVVSEDIINLGTGDKDAFGNALGHDLSGLVWNPSVNTVMVGASGVITCQLVSAASASSMSSGATVLASVSFPAASVAGVTRPFKLPAGSTALQYLATLYTNVGAAVTSSKFDSFLSADVEVPG